MKKLIYACFTFCSIIFFSNCNPPLNTGDTSQNSLDWKGSYSGVVPCADCEGILTRITLGDNNNYTLQTRYLGKSEEVISSTGSFEWNKEGNQIKLKDIKEGTAPIYYKVGENQLTQLDLQGNTITGQNASMYVFAKEGGNSLNKYWKLIEVNGNAVTASGSGKREPHMLLHTADNRVTGSGGCNSFTGSFNMAANDRLSFSGIASTKMFCNDAQQTEDLMFKALQNTDSYYLSGDTLQLIRARMAPLAKFVAVYLR